MKTALLVAALCAAVISAPFGAQAAMTKLTDHDLYCSVRPLTSKCAPVTPVAAIWIDPQATPDDIRHVMATSPYSRFPVCEGSFEELIGVVHAKNILAQVLSGQAMDLKALAKHIPTIPDSVPVLKALEAFRASAQTMAFVSDEYGSILGLVTLDDVLRNILGDMASPQIHTGEADAFQRPDGSWLFDGTKPVEEVKDILNLDSLPGEDENAYQTLGGFVMARLGRIPAVGDTLEADGWHYEVVDMDGRRVDKVLVANSQPLSQHPSQPDLNSENTKPNPREST